MQVRAAVYCFLCPEHAHKLGCGDGVMRKRERDSKDAQDDVLDARGGSETNA